MVLAAILLGSLQKAIRLEVEDGQLTHVTVSHERPGFSGKGYVTGFAQPRDGVQLSFQAKAGIYDLILGYSTPSGKKGFDVAINGRHISGMLEDTHGAFVNRTVGRVELAEGKNTFTWGTGWGYFEADRVEFKLSAKPAPVVKPRPIPVDRRATPEARNLLKRLVDSYGKTTFAGQYNQDDFDFVTKVASVKPSILGGDFMDYSPSRVEFGANPNGETERLVALGKKGTIITMSWHWNAPTGLLNKTYRDDAGNEVNALWYKGFYTNATTFNVQKALDDPHTPAFSLLIRDMDAIALELKKFAAAKVPVLWRPLHEADGGWFWWGAKGPDCYIRLWRLMFDRFTRIHNLHNLLWVDSSGGNPYWYPGNDVVDIVGIDAYPSDTHDPLTGQWDSLLPQHAGKKLLAITEFGGIPDVARMKRFGVQFSYFVSWGGTANRYASSPGEVKALYRNAAIGR